MIKQAGISKMLTELHKYYLRANRFDEGDLIYYRINYKLVASFGITKEEAQTSHDAYHKDNPRIVSEGYCYSCKTIVTFIPIIYGSSSEERKSLETAQNQGRLIISDLEYYAIKEGVKIPLYGCKVCKTALPRYGTMP